MNDDNNDLNAEFWVLIVILLIVIGLATVFGLIGFGYWTVAS